MQADEEQSKQKEQLMQMACVERDDGTVKGLEGQSVWNTKSPGQSLVMRLLRKEEPNNKGLCGHSQDFEEVTEHVKQGQDIIRFTF